MCTNIDIFLKFYLLIKSNLSPIFSCNFTMGSAAGLNGVLLSAL